MSARPSVACETELAKEPDLPVCLLLYRHVAHLAANALYSCPGPIPIPGLRNPSDVALGLILKVFDPLSRQAGCLQHLQNIAPLAH